MNLISAKCFRELPAAKSEPGVDWCVSEIGKRKMRLLSGRSREKLMSIKIQTNSLARNEL